MPVDPATTGQKAFSLIELLITLTIIAIVVGFAVPGWRSVLAEARRADATETLAKIVARQELFRLEHRRYADASELTLKPPSGLGLTDHTPGGHYRLELETVDTGYTAIASVDVAGSQQRDERCWTFGIETTGRRWSHSRSGEDTTRYCWKT